MRYLASFFFLTWILLSCEVPSSQAPAYNANTARNEVLPTFIGSPTITSTVSTDLPTTTTATASANNQISENFMKIPTPTIVVSSTKTPIPTPTLKPIPIVGFGDWFSLSNDVDDKSDIVLVESKFSNKSGRYEPNGIFLTFLLEMRNNGQRPLSPLQPLVEFRLFDDRGRYWERAVSECQREFNTGYFTDRVGPGFSEQYCMTFDSPLDAEGLELHIGSYKNGQYVSAAIVELPSEMADQSNSISDPTNTPEISTQLFTTPIPSPSISTIDLRPYIDIEESEARLHGATAHLFDPPIEVYPGATLVKEKSMVMNYAIKKGEWEGTAKEKYFTDMSSYIDWDRLVSADKAWWYELPYNSDEELLHNFFMEKLEEQNAQIKESSKSIVAGHIVAEADDLRIFIMYRPYFTLILAEEPIGAIQDDSVTPQETPTPEPLPSPLPTVELPDYAAGYLPSTVDVDQLDSNSWIYTSIGDGLTEPVGLNPDNGRHIRLFWEQFGDDDEVSIRIRGVSSDQVVFEHQTSGHDDKVDFEFRHHDTYVIEVDVSTAVRWELVLTRCKQLYKCQK